MMFTVNSINDWKYQWKITLENLQGNIQIPYTYKKIAMNKKQCLATKYQKTEIKPNKITMLVSLKRKGQRPSSLSTRTITLDVLYFFDLSVNKVLALCEEIFSSPL